MNLWQHTILFFVVVGPVAAAIYFDRWLLAAVVGGFTSYVYLKKEWEE